MSDSIELSERELEILQLVATGASNKEIAQALTISTNTVKVHLRNVFAKIEVSSRTEAAMYAVQHGLVESPGGETPSGTEGALGGVLGAHSVREVEQRRFPIWTVYALIFIGLLSLALIYFSSGQNVPPQATDNPSIPTQLPRWQTRSELGVPRYDMAVASYGNRLYTFGGLSDEGTTNIVEIYDPENDLWNSGPDKPVPVSQAGAGVIGGKAFIPGGLDAQGKATKIVEVYDMLEGTWSQAAGLPVAVGGYGLVVYEGALYVFGGWDGTETSGRVFRYDPDADAWQELTPLPTPRVFAGAVVVEESIYVIGGYDGTQALDVNEVYFPAREGQEDEAAWESRAPLPEGRYAMGITNVVDVVYAIGGYSSGGPLANSISYFPLENRWETFALPNSQAWARMSAVLFGTRLYLVGGEIDGAPSGQNLAYQAIYTVSLPSINK